MVYKFRLPHQLDTILPSKQYFLKVNLAILKIGSSKYHRECSHDSLSVQKGYLIAINEGTDFIMKNMSVVLC